MKQRPTIGLALGGGGARGLAHVELLKVPEREKIPIDLIVGTSIGALVGAAYAVNPDAIGLEKRIWEVLGIKGKESKGMKLLGRAQWDGDVKSDFLSRVVRIAQKEMFRQKIFQWPKMIFNPRPKNDLLSPKKVATCRLNFSNTK